MPEHKKAKIIEKGDIYFFYRPKVTDKEDIQRFYMILHPHKKKIYRLFIVGKKRLPEAEEHEKFWATLDIVTRQAKELRENLRSSMYETKTRGARELPEARPCGEGIYCLAVSDKKAYLAYQLELPHEPSQVQEELNIDLEACYIISVKNQMIAGTTGGKAASFPKWLLDKFRNLRFIPADQPEFLNYVGVEILLIGAGKNVQEKLQVDLNPQAETFNTAEIFNDLKMWKNKHTTKPLFEGKWA